MTNIFLSERRKIFDDIKKYYKTAFAKQTFIPGKTLIQPGGRFFDEKDIIALVNASLDFWLTEGRFAETFKKDLAKYLGIPHIVLTNSGSSANLLAFSALTSPLLKEKRIKPGDEVIGVGASFPATVNPIIQLGAVPVLLDIQLETLNVNTAQIEKAITKKTKAIFLAHSIGNPFDVKTVAAIAKKHTLFLIEDCCDAIGAQYAGKMAGSFGDMATYSFYPGHHITTGEGGAVATKNPFFRDIVLSLREWGREGDPKEYRNRFSGKTGELPSDYDHRYVYTHMGYNLKITDMQAALGVSQLKKLPRFIAIRNENFRLLTEGLAKYKKYLILHKPTLNAKPSWFGFPVTVREGSPFSRAELVKHLEANGIGVRMFFAGNVTKQPYFKDVTYSAPFPLTNTDYVMKQTFWFGLYPAVTKEMIRHIIKTFDVFMRNHTPSLKFN